MLLKITNLPIILVYSIKDISKYLSKKVNCNMIKSFKHIIENIWNKNKKSGTNEKILKK